MIFLENADNTYDFFFRNVFFSIVSRFYFSFPKILVMRNWTFLLETSLCQAQLISNTVHAQDLVNDCIIYI